MKNKNCSVKERENDVVSDAMDEYYEQEIDEVSLDPKWAKALREISIRLTNQNAMQAHCSRATLSNGIDDNSISSFATPRTFAESKNQNPQHDSKNRTDCLLASGHASEKCTPLIEMRLHDDNSLTVTTRIKLTNNKRGSFDDKEIHPRAKSNPSFITALVHNAKCSFHSVNRSESRSRGNNMEAAEMVRMSNDEKERVSEKEIGLPHLLHAPSALTNVFELPLEAKMNLQTELKLLAVDVPASEQQGIREPFTHPEYKLGDTAREEDMVVFNKTSQQETSTKFYTSSETDEELSMSKGEERQINVIQRTIGQLQHLDAAFGKSTYIFSDINFYQRQFY